MSDVKVLLWGIEVGTVTWLEDRGIAVFQYNSDFIRSGIQLSPLLMPLSEFPYEFPHLAKNTFRGLPGLLADSLPDKFGNIITDAWLVANRHCLPIFNPVMRLCLVGNRGMGSLKFHPAITEPHFTKKEIDIAKLVNLSNKILCHEVGIEEIIIGDGDMEVLEDLFQVGTSAGGSRAKAIVTWNPETNQFFPDRIIVPTGFEQWIIKFDGISNNRDKENADPQGFGKIEYAYYLMALEAGIEMMPSYLHHEGGRSHFMTKRFDRTTYGNKLHTLSLGGIAHFDFNQPANYSYEQAIQIMKKLGLPQKDLEQLVLRAMFNVVGRNQDDHVKNITFLMNREGEWRLSPAFDITYAYDPNGFWTSKHQMSINGKRDQFSSDDLCSLAKFAGIKTKRAIEMLGNVICAVRQWPDIADKEGVDEANILQIQANRRLSLLD